MSALRDFIPFLPSFSSSSSSSSKNSNSKATMSKKWSEQPLEWRKKEAVDASAGLKIVLERAPLSAVRSLPNSPNADSAKELQRSSRRKSMAAVTVTVSKQQKPSPALRPPPAKRTKRLSSKDLELMDLGEDDEDNEESEDEVDDSLDDFKESPRSVKSRSAKKTKQPAAEEKENERPARKGRKSVSYDLNATSSAPSTPKPASFSPKSALKTPKSAGGSEKLANYEIISSENVIDSKRKRRSVNYNMDKSPEEKKQKPSTPTMRKLAMTNSASKSLPSSLQKRKNKKLNMSDLENLAEEMDDDNFDPSGSEESSSSSEEEEDSTDEEDFATPRIHKRGRGRPAAAKGKTATPKSRGATPKSREGTPSGSSKKRQMTPRVPKRRHQVPSSLPAIQEAQVRLHVSAVPDSLPCRENEFAEILSFTEGKISEGSGGCMYISGVPGTGKTAPVLEVMRTLREYVESGELDDFSFIDINGMRLTDPNQAYVQIYKQMSGGQKATADHAQTLLDKRFAGEGLPGEPKPAKGKRKTTVLLVDELDMLWNRKQSVLYNLFEWPTRATSGLVVLAIANTMDLPERIMMNRVSSRLGLTRLTFSPYTHVQLQEIVTTRLAGLEVFDRDALTLVARKVASLSGDARRALDICRRATEIAQQEAEENKKKAPCVDMNHVKRAHEEMFCSPKIMAIRCSSRYEQMFLRAIVFCFEKSGLEETSFERAFDALLEQLVLEGLPRMNSAEGFELLFGLSATGLVLAEHGRLGPHLRIRLNVSTDDVTFALNNSAD